MHYLVSRGANPDLRDKDGRSARDIPMSLLAQNRFGTPVVQPQVLAAIEAGSKDYVKNVAHPTHHGARGSRNVKRSAVERALVRFKRAERYMIDADRARQAGQFEVAQVLFSFACEETRANKLVREEMELRAKAATASEHASQAQKQLLAYRLKYVKDTLQAEAQRNFFLAERYIAEKSVSGVDGQTGPDQTRLSERSVVGVRLVAKRRRALTFDGFVLSWTLRSFFFSLLLLLFVQYQVAVQCLSVCLQYEPDNQTYQSKLAFVRQQQTRASNASAADAVSSHRVATLLQRKHACV